MKSQNAEEKPIGELKRIQNNIFILTMHSKYFKRELIEFINECLDEIEATEGPVGLITTSSHRTTYSGGLDFEVMQLPKFDVQGYLMQFNKLLARFIKLGFPTVACINGHCYAAGMMFAFCHDFRFMVKTKAVFCLPEIDLGFHLPPGMLFIFRNKIHDSLLKRIAIFGEKIGAEEAFENGMVEKIMKKEELLDTCVGFIRRFVEKSKYTGIMADIKLVLYYESVKAAEERWMRDGPMRQ